MITGIDADHLNIQEIINNIQVIYNIYVHYSTNHINSSFINF